MYLKAQRRLLSVTQFRINLCLHLKGDFMSLSLSYTETESVLFAESLNNPSYQPPPPPSVKKATTMKSSLPILVDPNEALHVFRVMEWGAILEFVASNLPEEIASICLPVPCPHLPHFPPPPWERSRSKDSLSFCIHSCIWMQLHERLQASSFVCNLNQM